MFKKTLNKLLRKEEIQRNDDNKVYLLRWTIARFKKSFWLWKLLGIADIRLYLHKFVGDDLETIHWHPNDFITFIFWGKYKEWTYNTKTKTMENKIYKAPYIRKLKSSHTHRIEIIDNKPAWSMVLMFPKVREWGFLCFKNGKAKAILWQEYIKDYLGKGKCE